MGINKENFFTILFVLWFVLTPLFWIVDLSGSHSGVYDFFSMAPLSVFHLIVFYGLGVVSIYFKGVSLVHLLLFSFYFPLIQLSNYPLLTIRDAYLHATPTELMLINGQLSHSTDPIAASWPGSFYLQGIFSTVSGFDLITSNYVLYFVLILIVALTLYSLAHFLEKNGYKIAWICGLLFLCLFFNNLLDNFHHYSRTALAFTFLIFFLYSFLRFRDNEGLVLHVLLITSIILTHPFQSLVLLFFLVSYWFLAKIRGIKENRRTNLTLFSLIASLGWLMFQSYPLFLQGIDTIRTIFSPKIVEPIVGSLGVRLLPWWGIILRDYYKYALFALLGLAIFAALICFVKKIRYDNITIVLSSILFSSLILSIVLFAVPSGNWQIGRLTAFLAFPAAFSSLMLAKKALNVLNLKAVLSNLTKYKVKFLIILFVISLSASVMVLRFERNYYFGELVHSSEISAISFLFNSDVNSTVTTISWQTSVYASYLDTYIQNSSHKILRIWHAQLGELKSNSTELFSVQMELINKSDFVIRGLRDDYTFYNEYSGETIMGLIDQELEGPNFDKIYSNSYYVIYERRIAP